jgi:hypothetical protein
MPAAAPPDYNALAKLFIPQRTSETDTGFTKATPGAIDLSNLVAGIGLSQATSPQTDLISNILYRAKLAFSPNLAEERSSGLYDTTTKNMLANEAIARATSESAAAVLAAQQKGLESAGAQSREQLAASKTTGASKANVAKPGLGDTLSSALIGTLGVQGAKKVWDKIMKGTDTATIGSDAPISTEAAMNVGAPGDVGAGTSVSSFEAPAGADIAASTTGVDLASGIAGGSTSLAPAIALGGGYDTATAAALGIPAPTGGTGGAQDFISAGASDAGGGIGGAVGSFGPAEGAAAAVGATEVASAAGIGDMLAGLAEIFAFA